ncbi:prolipoprotein diacylglyceryl transferase [Alphaproteobacteria bacterium]|nr:prolipoprotein diacylglyceryl transferase [Alphaproteobacteria bacterium]
MFLISLPFPTISPEIISFGGFSIKWYGVSYIAGILLGWIFIRRLSKKNKINLSLKETDDLVIWLTLGIIIGGRIGYTIFYNPNYYLTNPIEIFALWQGGMSFHGGIIGVTLSIILFSLSRKKQILQISDYISLVAPIGIFFGRIANFINQELWGRISQVPWAIEFPLGGFIPRHPSQLYEAFFEGVVVFLVLIILWYKSNFKNKPGLLTGIFVSLYSIGRIFVENFREPDSHIGFIFQEITMGQLLSFPLLIFGLFIVFLSKKNTNIS